MQKKILPLSNLSVILVLDMKIQFTLQPVKQRIHFAPATKYFVDKKKKQNKNACR